MASDLEQRLQQNLPSSLRLERELPAGGMARVFLAEDVSLGRRVVVKVLDSNLTEGLSADRFRREIQLAAQLQHPHLVPVLQAGEAGGIPYFVMPYVTGESLRNRLRDGQAVPPREAVTILRDVARAMSYAHAQGVVHRDIKPDNVLLSGGAAMVTDFGIAKALSSSRTLPSTDGNQLTGTGSSLGTPAYMAPEQIAADPDADHRVDIYAFGVMAYELLSGHTPFHDRSPQALLTAYLVEAPPPLAGQVQLPRSLASLVMACLEKDPARRPASAASLVEGLDAIQWTGEQAAPVVVSRSWASVWIGTGVLVILATAGWWWRHRESGPPPNPHLMAVVPFRVASADPALHYLREGMLDLLAAKLPGEGGLQASDPRATLDAWRGAGGSSDIDLPTAKAQRLAETQGAAWLLQGDVVGTPTRVTLNASLFAASGTEPRTRISVEGPPDSLGGLVDQLVGRLLTELSDSGTQGQDLTRRPLPALRAYLDAVALFRQGSQASVPRFREALDQDSSFALAALGAVQATGWWNEPALTERGLRLAWAGRNQLSAKDQALLIATAGPHYPAPSSTREIVDAAQRYLQLAPERADAWYLYGDKIYHFGQVIGLPDRSVKSAFYFEKALAVDSSYVPGYIHLQQLAVELGDTALDRRLDRLRSRFDTSSDWKLRQSWYRAAATGDSATVNRIWRSIPASTELLLEMGRTPLDAMGVGIDDGLRAWDSLAARATSPQAQRDLHGGHAVLALVAGKPELARRELEQSVESPDDPQLLGIQILNAIFEPGDSIAALHGVQVFRRIAAAPRPADSLRAILQAGARRALAFWDLTRGDTAGVAAEIERLRAGTATQPTSTPSLDTRVIAALEALFADRRKSPDAARLALRLDSLQQNANYSLYNPTREEVLALITARLLEKYQSPAAALNAVRRRPTWWVQVMPYLATQLREEGRLAALTGAKEEAIASYRHYLALRSDPEPSVRPEVEEVRKELGKLEVGGER